MASLTSCPASTANLPPTLFPYRLSGALRFVQSCELQTYFPLPFYGSGVKAGFPSPAEDYAESALDLNQYLIQRPAATFFVRASGSSMIGAGIFDKDLLIVDRSVEPASGKIVIAAVNGELTVKRFQKTSNGGLLLAANPDYPPMRLSDSDHVHIWGVVVHVVHTP